MNKKPKENVNHPAHFHAGNVVKYVARYEHKNGVEDLKKARWYLDRLIQKLESTK